MKILQLFRVIGLGIQTKIIRWHYFTNSRIVIKTQTVKIYIT